MYKCLKAFKFSSNKIVKLINPRGCSFKKKTYFYFYSYSILNIVNIFSFQKKKINHIHNVVYFTYLHVINI